jgi:type I restriction enzyme S subunit
MSDGGGQPNISKDKIAKFSISVPPVNEQDEIVKHLDAVVMKFGELKQKIQIQITLLRERRTSLISHAVTGKVKIT